MVTKVKIVIALICLTIFGFKPDGGSKVNKKGKIISTGYWVPNNVVEVKGLMQGPFVRLRNGNLLTVMGNKTYVSKEEGRNWSVYSLIADTDRFEIVPGALIRTYRNVIILSFVNLKEKSGWNWQKNIHDAPNAILPTYVVRSLDDGKTWQDMQKLHEAWTGANRDMIETNDGNIVLTSMIMHHHPGRHTVLTYTSKDEGKTWTPSNIIDLGGSGSHGGVMESTLVQLKGGRLWMLMRTDWGDFWQAFSSDDGLTWKDIGPTNIDASSSPGIIKRLQDGRLVLVWNRLFPEGKKEFPLKGGHGNLSEVPSNWQREQLSIMFSNDDGNTWSRPIVIAKTTKKGSRLVNIAGLSYPYVFEVKPGVLWITTQFVGRLRIQLNERDFISHCKYK